MLVDSPQSNNIDRLPDHLFELTAFDNCFVRDKYGKSVRIQDIRKNHICIFVLVRVSTATPNLQNSGSVREKLKHAFNNLKYKRIRK